MPVDIPSSDLWKYEGCEFNSVVGGQKVRVIFKSSDSKHVTVSNYYHRNNTCKIKLKSFLDSFTLIK